MKNDADASGEMNCPQKVNDSSGEDLRGTNFLAELRKLFFLLILRREHGVVAPLLLGVINCYTCHSF